MARRPTYKRVASLLRYEPETGRLFWRVSPAPRVKTGDRAGTEFANGYRYIGFGGARFTAPCIAWLLVKKRWPSGPIKFSNNDPSDCRWTNIKAVTRTKLMIANRRRMPASGFRGVTFHRGRNKWMARIQLHHRSMFLGYFEKRQEAASARRRAERQYFDPLTDHPTI